MDNKYLPAQFESKWRGVWKREKISNFKFQISNQIQTSKSKKAKKYYILVELPYTSGDLHVGHWFSFAIPDMLARFKRMNGYNVFYPIGYDAFGLPAENAAIKRKVHPRDWTLKNIEMMTKQFQTMGTMLNNWDDVVITCLPEYYRWNQWIFLKMFERGLAYRGKAQSNWCPSCQTVLANENIENGKCWRCGSQVIQKEVEQWFLKITDYADNLIWNKNSNGVDWPKQVQVGQNNWIGRKEGINITYKVKDTKEVITCFTTRPDTNFGATFIVIAPEHPFATSLLNLKLKINNSKLKEIKDYLERAKKKTEEQRKIEANKKTGVFTGFYAVNDLNGKLMPVWISDFVLAGFGTGAVVGVPGHDIRDFEFAKQFGIEIIRVVVGKDGDKLTITKPEQIQEEEGTMINSGFLNGLDIHEATKVIMKYLENKGWGKKTVTYHLRDWSVSRQRYWGTPVPIIYCRNCWEVKNEKSKVTSKEGIDYIKINDQEYAINTVPEKDLPVELPYEVDFTPKGKPPLATNEKWMNVKCPNCGAQAKRDSETLDTFFDSAWYWFRYLSPHYDKGPFDKTSAKKMTPLDVYFGGSEHTLGHTMYARFFTKFFHDLGLVDYEEFALKRIQHGIVLGPDGNRMSKSKGNVINPDDVVAEYGSDTVRMYLCFMMPYEATGPWSDKTIAGVNRFLNRVWKVYQGYKDTAAQFFITRESPHSAYGGMVPSKVKKIASASSKKNNKTMKQFNNFSEDKSIVVKLNKTIQKVTNDIEKIKMNTAIASMMELINEWEQKLNIKQGTLSRESAKKFVQILAPFAPHMTEEIWRNLLGEKESIHLSGWPKAEETVTVEVTIPVQVNGKVRSVISLPVDQLSEKTVLDLALKDEKVRKYLEGNKYKTVYVKAKILNFVII